MSIRQRNTFVIRARGFSMIDVLVSIIVLATAMLALAALQGTLTRSTADSRARTQIASYGDGLMDQLRADGYANVKVTGSTTINSSTVCTSLSGAEKTACQNRATVESAAGVSNLTTKITYVQYAKTSDANPSFSVNTGTPSTDEGAYKQVNVTNTWTDATGASRSMSLDSIISYTLVDTGDNTLITNQPPPTSAAIAPTVRQYNPGATAGVIPIAIGSSTDTAATNPKPEVLGSKNNLSSVGVTFNVLTYQSPDSSNLAVIQKNVDTKVIACSCAYGGVVSSDSNLSTVFAQPYRPTYWDGTHYVSPDKASSATSNTGVNSSSSYNDVDCDVCCRDRNDAGIASGDVLFDPFSGDTKHYQYTGSTLNAVSSGTYVNACRLIRVDGVYATATDIRNYFFNLLGTDSAADTGVPSSSSSSQPASSPIPADKPPSAFPYVTNYQTFVKNYLGDSISSFKSGSDPAAPSSDPATTPGNTATIDYTAAAPTNPSNISITYNASTPDYRYLHARGLYIDHLEQPAIDAINNAYTNCPTGTSKSDCVLPFVPFTTINLTELANWSPTVQNIITASDNAITASGVDYFQNPLRGIVSVLSKSVANNATASAEATIGLSNSGLSGILNNWAISPYDQNNTLSDSQLFTVSNASGGGGGSGTVYFDINLTNLAWLNAASSANAGSLAVSWSGTALQLGTAASGQLTLDGCTVPGTNTDTYVGTVTTSKNGQCPNTDTPAQAVISVTPPVGLTVTVQGYNNAQSLTETVSCSGTNGGSASVTSYQCMNYSIDTSKIYVNSTAVAGATVSYTNDGLKTESAAILLPSTPGVSSTSSSSPDLIKIAFGTGVVNSTVHGTCSACNKSGHSCSITNAVASSCP